jgi:metal-responsive CopG/Arc/MetJ family transcriptional regulator
MAAKIYEHALLIKMPDDLVRDIDDARRAEADIPNRSEMVRRLIAEAIAARRIARNVKR